MSHPVPVQQPGHVPRHFGLFYPIGYLVAAFPRREDAERVLRDLLTGGYDPLDCLLHDSEEVKTVVQRNLDDNTGWLSNLGWSDEALRLHLDAAARGATFLVIYAPDELSAGRAVNVIRRVPFEFIHRYHRFAIEEVK